MTKTSQPAKPETLDTEQLDAAVGGTLAAIVPCVKIGVVTTSPPCIKTVRTGPHVR